MNEKIMSFLKNRASIASLGVVIGGLLGYNSGGVEIPPIKVEIVNFSIEKELEEAPRWPATYDEELKPPTVYRGVRADD